MNRPMPASTVATSASVSAVGGPGARIPISDYDLMRQGSAESSHPSSELSLTDHMAYEMAGSGPMMPPQVRTWLVYNC